MATNHNHHHTSALQRLWTPWTSQTHSSVATLVPSLPTTASLRGSTAGKSPKPSHAAASVRSRHQPSPRLGAAQHPRGSCPTRAGFGVWLPQAPDPLSHPTGNSAAFGTGTYFRMSLQNSRAVRGQPLFSRNIRCLKRARKKALRGDSGAFQPPALERSTLCHSGPETHGPAPAPHPPRGPGHPAWCSTGRHRPLHIPISFLHSFVEVLGQQTPVLLIPAPQGPAASRCHTPANNSGQEKRVNPQNLHPAWSQRHGTGWGTNTQTGVTGHGVQVTDGTRPVSEWELQV